MRTKAFGYLVSSGQLWSLDVRLSHHIDPAHRHYQAPLVNTGNYTLIHVFRTTDQKVGSSNLFERTKKVQLRVVRRKPLSGVPGVATGVPNKAPRCDGRCRLGLAQALTARS